MLSKKNQEKLKALMRLIPNILLICFVGIIFYRMIFKNYQITTPDVILIATFVIFSLGIIEKVEVIAIGEKGVSARFSKVEEDITIINQIAKHVLTEGELTQLERLAGRDDNLYATYTHFLEQEMVRLCQHGFVKENNKDDLWKMRHHGSNQFNLRTYFWITEEGRKYLKILKDLENKQKQTEQ
ncbi:MAG TPA: hypothetical protein DCF68_02030 [Cyanothece sp. UBA12306]|nr:hypothetical protein [Cyanothece sp. UBA12306]